jgi:hypothetical protein
MITNKTLELFDSNIKNELNTNMNIDICLPIYNYTSLKYEYKSSHKEILKKSKEQYKDIPEYEGHYQISNLGNIKSLKRNGERIMNPCIDKTKGYLRVNLFKESKRKSLYVHQLVAIAFLGHKPNGNKLVVDHMDNDKTNNRLDNLQVISSRENSSKDQWRHNPSSYFVGVSYSSGKKKWESSISVNGISFYLGCFKNESNAGQEYANALEYIDKRSNLIDYPFKTNRRGFNEADINQLTFVFSQ